MKILKPYLRENEFLIDDKLTIADFYIGGLYTNFMKNSKLAKVDWANVKIDFPGFVAYGERFAMANARYLKKRPVRNF